MNVYLVISKVFYLSNGKEYQVADALEPITVVSSYKKAQKAMYDYTNYYRNLGYRRTDHYNNQFPVEHFTMKNESTGNRVIIYTLKEEVD